MAIRHLKVFERGCLRVDNERFLAKDLELLAKYEEETRTGAFRIGWNKVDFQGHVGVFAHGDLVLEILPKAEPVSSRESDGLRLKWSRALVRMLETAYELPLTEAGSSRRSLGEESLLDVYARHFLSLVQSLLRGGLARGYRRVRERVQGYRGKAIHEPANLQASIHQESLLCEYDEFSRDIPRNALIALALRALRHLPIAPDTVEHAARLAEDFPETAHRRVSEQDFSSLRWDRRTTAYRPAMDVARFILLGLSPLQSGQGTDTLALLFPMNDLFEAFVGILLRRAAWKRGAVVTLQSNRRFWESRYIRPDILVKAGDRMIILDTKWKTPVNLAPSVEDVRQMYAYNKYFGAKEAWLLYPRLEGPYQREGKFRGEGEGLSCGLMFIDLFDAAGELDTMIGERVLERLGVASS